MTGRPAPPHDATRVSRRSFLRTTGAAGAAWATFHIVPATVLGNSAGTPPSERITLGIIGVKKMGRGHVQTLLGRSDVQLVAVCDVDTEARTVARQTVNQHYAEQRRSGTYADCAAYNEYEQLLARPDIDAVLIATPNHWHAIMTIAACRAGKDVYCEKPLTLTIGEGRAVIAAAQWYGRIVQTGSQQRSSAEFRRACELVRSGLLGTVRRVHVEVGPCSRAEVLPTQPTPPGLDYDRWLGPAPWAPYHKLRCGSNFDDGWRRLRDYSGGKMTDWGAHHFDIVQWALAMDASGPLEIVPPPGPYDWSRLPRIIEGTGASEFDPTRGLTYHYPGGVEVIKDGRRGILFDGTEGRLEVDRGHLQTWPASLRNYRLRATDAQLPQSDNHHSDWLACLRTRRQPIATAEIGHRSATVCHLGNIALWLGRPLRWDPVRERIIGDEGASRWLERPRRAPYHAL